MNWLKPMKDFKSDPKLFLQFVDCLNEHDSDSFEVKNIFTKN